MKKTIAMLILLCAAVFAQQKGSFTDPRDKKTYKTVKIGTQTWMAENLNYNAKGSKCYDNKSANCDKYGRLYSWETSKSVCPAGWHLPSDAEWTLMIDFVGGKKIAGTKLKAKSGWNEIYYENQKNESGNGEDKFGFSALPGGHGNSDGTFHSFGVSGFGGEGIWWSATDINNDVWPRSMYNRSDYVDRDDDFDKPYLLSVRCVQDNAESEAEAAKVKAEIAAKAAELKANSGTFTDARDKKIYKTIKIGSQIWMAENLNYNAKDGKCYDNKESNCKEYGRLYNWETAMSVCPSGWHLPSNKEWDKLMRYADGTNGTDSPYNSPTAGKYLKATNGWTDEEVRGNGVDKFGFSALPGGDGNPDGYFYSIGKNGDWWSSSSEHNSNEANYWTMFNNQKNVYCYSDAKYYLKSVRCVKD